MTEEVQRGREGGREECVMFQSGSGGQSTNAKRGEEEERDGHSSLSLSFFRLLAQPPKKKSLDVD